jgi:hypothetical protein
MYDQGEHKRVTVSNHTTINNMMIQFGNIEILEMDKDESSNDLLGDKRRLLTMTVNDFERRRLMRSKGRESEVECFFFLDRMASTVSQLSSQKLRPPQRRQSVEPAEAMILNPMEQEAPSNNNPAQPPKPPQRRRSVEVSIIVRAKKSSADDPPSVRRTKST